MKNFKSFFTLSLLILFFNFSSDLLSNESSPSFKVLRNNRDIISSPFFSGLSQRIELQASEEVTIQIKHPDWIEGTKVKFFTTHGGRINRENKIIFDLDHSGFIEFDFKIGSYYGNYPLLIKALGKEYSIEFWVSESSEALIFDEFQAINECVIQPCDEHDPPCGNGDGDDNDNDCEDPSGEGRENTPPSYESNSGNGCSSSNSHSLNPFNPYSATVFREIEEINIPLIAGTQDMSLVRNHMSRPDSLNFTLNDLPFGDGGHWRHSFQWTIAEVGRNDIGSEVIRIIYPSGRFGNFEFKSNDDVYMTFEPSTHERVRKIENHFYSLIMLDGTQYFFSTDDEGEGRRFRIDRVIDRYGYTTTYEYEENLLRRVVGTNENQFISFNYRNLPHSIAPGETEFSYTNPEAHAVFLVGSFNGWNTQSHPMEQNPITGEWQTSIDLERGSYEYKFFVSTEENPEGEWIQDPNNTLWSAPFANSVLLVEPYKIIDSIESYDGRRVQYHYDWQPGENQVHIVLSRVTYPNGEEAHYNYYSYEEESRRILLHTADDPMYQGPARQVEYIYQENGLYPGQIQEERHLETGDLFGSLQIDINQPRDRLVTRANGSQHNITYTGNNAGRALNYLNALGRSYEKTYFNGNGMLESKTDPEGNTISYERTFDFGAITRIRDSLRGDKIYRYTHNNWPFYLREYTDEFGRTTRYERNRNKQITRTIYPDGTSEELEFNEDGLPLVERDKNGTETRHSYNEQGLRIQSIFPSGLVENYTYTPEFWLSEKTNNLGQMYRYHYNTRGQITQIEYPDRSHEEKTYDDYGQLIRSRSRDGVLTRYEYNIFGYQTAIIDTYNNRVEYDYDLLGNRILEVYPNGKTIHHDYDNIERKTRSTYQDGSFEAWVYGSEGLESYTDRLGHTTRYEYNDRGEIIRIVNPLGQEENRIYDERGNLIEIIDALGNSTIYSYDINDRIESFTNCREGLTRIFRDNKGREIMRQLPSGVQEDRVYDDTGRLIELYRGDQLISSWTYNEISQLIEENTKEGLHFEYTYDDRGRPQEKIYPDGTSSIKSYRNAFFYQERNRNGDLSFHELDRKGRVLLQTDQEESIIEYRYGAEDELLAIIDPNNNITEFTYDEENRKTSKTYNDGTQIQYRYNANGWLTHRIDEDGDVTQYFYNALGKLREIHYPDESIVTMTYDELNRLTSRKDKTGVTHYHYENSCPQKTEIEDPLGYHILKAYDNSSRLTELSIEGSAYEITYNYDELGRISHIHSPEGLYTYKYHGVSQLIDKISRPNDVTTEQNYDEMARLIQKTHFSENNIIDDYRYTYNNLDQKQTITDIYDFETEITYDKKGQIKTAIQSDSDNKVHLAYNYSYLYDEAGNPTVQNKNGEIYLNSFNDLNQIRRKEREGNLTVQGNLPENAEKVVINGRPARNYEDGSFALNDIAPYWPYFTIKLNFLDSEGQSLARSHVTAPPLEQGYSYDNHGNQVHNSRFQYYYDDKNQLIKIRNTVQHYNLLENIYDEQGRRKSRIIDRGPSPNHRFGRVRIREQEHYLYHGWQVIAVLDEDMEIKETFTHGIDLSGNLGDAGGVDGLLSQSDHQGTTYYLSDAMGNITSLSNENAEKIAYFKYSPFGETLISRSSRQVRYGFSSKEKDALGLYYYGYRFYDPDLGRWLNRDPIGERGGMNIYRMVSNNPIKFYDALGLEPEENCDCENGAEMTNDAFGGSCCPEEITEIEIWISPPGSSGSGSSGKSGSTGHNWIHHPDIGHCGNYPTGYEDESGHNRPGPGDYILKTLSACPEASQDILDQMNNMGNGDANYGAGPGKAPNCTEAVCDILQNAGCEIPNIWTPWGMRNYYEAF